MPFYPQHLAGTWKNLCREKLGEPASSSAALLSPFPSSPAPTPSSRKLPLLCCPQGSPTRPPCCLCALAAWCTCTSLTTLVFTDRPLLPAPHQARNFLRPSPLSKWELLTALPSPVSHWSETSRQDKPSSFFYFFFFKFILAALGLCCLVWAFSSCGEWGLLFVAVHGILISVASLVVENRL